MRYQPNRDYVSNDDVQTPPELARRLVAHFDPSGRILEPCRGEGHLLAALRAHAATSRLYWCEIKAGRDFLACRRRVDWIVTNPPWSQLRAFLRHAMTLADEVVFLVTINHLWTRARLRDIAEAGFGLREIVLVDTPASFPPSGFQLGAVHLSRGWRGDIALRRLGAAPERARYGAEGEDGRTEGAAPEHREGVSRAGAPLGRRGEQSRQSARMFQANSATDDTDGHGYKAPSNGEEPRKTRNTRKYGA